MKKINWVSFSMNIHPGQMDKLNKIHKETGRTKSDTIREALNYYFKTLKD